MSLQVFRQQLDAIDEQIMDLLGRRFAICREVAAFKRTNRIPMMQPDRIAQVQARCADLAARHGVDAAFARQLYDAIIGEACRLEAADIGPEQEQA